MTRRDIDSGTLSALRKLSQGTDVAVTPVLTNPTRSASMMAPSPSHIPRTPLRPSHHATPAATPHTAKLLETEEEAEERTQLLDPEV